MGKKIISFLVSLFLLVWVVGSANASNETNTIKKENIKTTVLEWSIFSKSNALKPENWKGKRIDCSKEQIQNLIEMKQVDENKYEAEIDKIKETDPGYVRDIKGCMMESKMNSLLSWLVYIVIMALIIYTLYIVTITLLGGGKWSGGWQDPFDPGDWGWKDELMWKIKNPLVWAVILFALVLWILNPILKAVVWLIDAIFG